MPFPYDVPTANQSDDAFRQESLRLTQQNGIFGLHQFNCPSPYQPSWPQYPTSTFTGEPRALQSQYPPPYQPSWPQYATTRYTGEHQGLQSHYSPPSQSHAAVSCSDIYSNSSNFHDFQPFSENSPISTSLFRRTSQNPIAQHERNEFHQRSSGDRIKKQKTDVLDSETNTPPHQNHEPQKHIVDQVFAEDGSPLARLIHFDTTRARDKAIRLCTQNQRVVPRPSSFVDIVFFTDASARGTTKSDDPDQCIKEWDRMQANPVEWRSAVAIAWIVSSSPDINFCFTSEGTGCEVGSWIPKSTRVGVPTSYHRPAEDWKPVHEAAWQVAGLQHFQQAELLGLLFALNRAVYIFQQLDAELQEQERTGTRNCPKKTITILTDSKPAMWDLTGFNVRTEAERTKSDYWVSREANTRNIVQKAKESMQILRELDVEIKIQWTPGHSNVPGNEWVDKMSRRVRLAPSRIRPESLLRVSNFKLRDEACWFTKGLDWVKHAIVVDTMAPLRFDSTAGQGPLENEMIPLPLAGTIVVPAVVEITAIEGAPPLMETLALEENPAEQTATAEATEIDIINSNKTEEGTDERGNRRKNGAQ